jgi:hypothetical protein
VKLLTRGLEVLEQLRGRGASGVETDTLYADIQLNEVVFVIYAP